MTTTTTPAPTIADLAKPFEDVWAKIKTVFKAAEQKAIVIASEVEHEAAIVFTVAEQKVVAIAAPIFQAAEAEAMSDVIAFIRGVLTAHPNPGSMTLPDWETAVLNAGSKLGGDLHATLNGMGSNLIQALVGLVLHSLPGA